MSTRRHALAWTAGGLLAASGASVWAQPARATVDPLADLDGWLDAQRIGWRVPALAVALLKDGRVIYLKAFGYRDAAQSLPANTETIFRAGSVSKAFGAATVAMLVDEGRMAWDAPVTTYVPELRFAGGDAYGGITLRDMLSHRTGLPRHELLWYNNQSLTRQSLVARMPHLEMSAPLRARYQYNNLMVVLAGLAVERVTGQTWEAFTRARLLAPMGMTRVNLSAPEMAADINHAVGHTRNGARKLVSVPLRHDPLLGPAGAVNASIGELAKWVQLQLGRGQFDGRRLISTAAMAAMWEPLVATGPAPTQADAPRSHVGLGWRIDRYRDTLRVAHGGDLNGFTSRVVLLPEKNAGLAVLVNHGSHPLPNAVTPDLLDRLLGLRPEDHASRVMARRNAAEAVALRFEAAASAPNGATPRPPRPHGAYVGRYSHPGYGELTVGTAGEALSVRYNDMPALLEYRQGELFETRTERPEHGDFSGLKMSFQGDDKAGVIGIAADMQEGVQPILFRRTA
ncbi:MAG: serine hydrolase [Betaproteobacteria bacterium]|nr:serine hydrolase [Betaproteobacteria bacterium]